MKLRNHMMPRRTRETQNCFFNILQKTLWRKFRVFEELAWLRYRRTLNCPCWGEARIILRRRTEAKHHQRKVRNPVGTS